MLGGQVVEDLLDGRGVDDVLGGQVVEDLWDGQV